MVLSLSVTVVIAGVVVGGLITSRRHRHVDRQHSITFAGFCSAATAVSATALCLLVANSRSQSSNSSWQGILFISGTIAVGAIFITFVAGLFSRGWQRFALVGCGVLLALTYLMTLVSHFGD
jgi:hypothetical protein